MIKIKNASCTFEREPLSQPFGFKGGECVESWQAVTLMESEGGTDGMGVSSSCCLWSDPAVVREFGDVTSSCIMFMMTSFANRTAKGMSFETPFDLIDRLLPMTLEYGKKLTGNPDMKETYALNALVSVDIAAWVLYAREKGLTSFDDLIPDDAKPILSGKQTKVANIPAITYGIPIEEIRQMIDDGYFFLKIKLGSDPAKDGDYEKMIEWDKQRMTEIHNIAKEKRTEYTDDGLIPYYLDMNGRYPNKDYLLRIIDHIDKIGAFKQISLIEEPFPEENKESVHDIPCRVVADESAHSVKNVIERIDLGYKAIAIKTVAKTLSISFRMAKAAYDRGIPCFCADLSASPVLREWNKNFTARLEPIPGIKIGAFESNGHQNYCNWEQMKSYHPCAGSSWANPIDGIFNLNNDYYEKSGGIFLTSNHYEKIVKGKH